MGGYGGGLGGYGRGLGGSEEDWAVMEGGGLGGYGGRTPSLSAIAPSVMNTRQKSTASGSLKTKPLFPTADGLNVKPSPVAKLGLAHQVIPSLTLLKSVSLPCFVKAQGTLSGG